MLEIQKMLTISTSHIKESTAKVLDELAETGNVPSIPCDTDTICAIGDGIAEEFYHGTGFNNNMLLKTYLDDNLYEIVTA